MKEERTERWACLPLTKARKEERAGGWEAVWGGERREWVEDGQTLVVVGVEAEVVVAEVVEGLSFFVTPLFIMLRISETEDTLSVPLPAV